MSVGLGGAYRWWGLAVRSESLLPQVCRANEMWMRDGDGMKPPASTKKHGVRTKKIREGFKGKCFTHAV